jgi:hypothetical protein
MVDDFYMTGFFGAGVTGNYELGISEEIEENCGNDGKKNYRFHSNYFP